MTERRIVQSTHTREVIPTTLAGDENCYLLAMTGDQIEILSNLLNYAHRKINWCDEVIDASRYFLPDEATWNDLQALVDDLEYRLMDVCELSELVDAIEALCTCIPSAQKALPGPLSSGALQDGLDDGSITFEEPVPDIEVDEDACASAQTLWHMMNEYISEVAIPLSDVGFELIVPAALAILRTWGVAIKALIKYGVTIGFIEEGLEFLTQAAGADTINWLLAAKQELICILYDYYRTGSAAYWEDLEDLIDSGDAPITVKPFLKLGFRCFRKTAQLFHGTTWALQRIESGYCDVCAEPFAENWIGTLCLTADFDYLACYDDAVALDVAKPAVTNPSWNIVAGTVEVGAWLTGYGGYGGTVHVVLRDSLENLLDEAVFVVASSTEIQYFSDTLTVGDACDGTTFRLYAEGSGVARVLQLGATNVPA